MRGVIQQLFLQKMLIHRLANDSQNNLLMQIQLLPTVTQRLLVKAAQITHNSPLLIISDELCLPLQSTAEYPYFITGEILQFATNPAICSNQQTFCHCLLSYCGYQRIIRIKLHAAIPRNYTIASDENYGVTVVIFKLVVRLA